jgi:chitin disaccharide deacetylase
VKSLVFILLRAREAEVTIEFDAQIRRALDVGLNLDHLDAHLHVNHVPAIGRVIRMLARRYALRAQRRLSERVRLTEMSNLRRVGHACALKVLGAIQPKEGAHIGVKSVGFMHSGHLTENRLYRLIGGLPPGCYELICHPGIADMDATDDRRRSKYQGRAELSALTAPRIRRLVRERGIRLCRWCDVS